MIKFGSDDGRDENGRKDEASNDNGGSGQRKRSLPLYRSVRNALYERIRKGEWTPGQQIPNEFQIAAEFGVSQGTARKALGMLADEGILSRRQGSGTRVSSSSGSSINIYDRKHRLIEPKSRVLKCFAARANGLERSALELKGSERVVRILRTLTHNGTPFIVEHISLPDSGFPGLAQDAKLPDSLYDFFQKTHKILTMTMEDCLSAVPADAEAAEVLGVPAGAPLLKIERVSCTLDGRPVEWSVRLCHLKDAYYLARSKWPTGAASA